MPLTSTWNIWTPDDTDNYDFIVDAAATAQTVDDALTQVETDLTATLGAGANFYTGTASQRAAFTTAPEGANWQDTDGSKLIYRRESGAWVPSSSGVSDTGTVSLPALTTGTIGSATNVSFSKTFTTVPNVSIRHNAVRLNMAVVSVSTTGFQYQAANFSPANQGAGAVLTWVAWS